MRATRGRRSQPPRWGPASQPPDCQVAEASAAASGLPSPNSCAEASVACGDSPGVASPLRGAPAPRLAPLIPVVVRDTVGALRDLPPVAVAVLQPHALLADDGGKEALVTALRDSVGHELPAIAGGRRSGRRNSFGGWHGRRWLGGRGKARDRRLRRRFGGCFDDALGRGSRGRRFRRRSHSDNWGRVFSGRRHRGGRRFGARHQERRRRSQHRRRRHRFADRHRRRRSDKREQRIAEAHCCHRREDGRGAAPRALSRRFSLQGGFRGSGGPSWPDRRALCRPVGRRYELGHRFLPRSLERGLALRAQARPGQCRTAADAATVDARASRRKCPSPRDRPSPVHAPLRPVMTLSS